MVRQEIRESLDRYVHMGVPTGGFLQAVLENNLVGACMKADLQNQRDLVDIVCYMHSSLPAASWGTPEKVEAWLATMANWRILGADHSQLRPV